MNIEQINALTREAYNKTALKYHENFRYELEQKEYDRLLLDRFSDLLKKNSRLCDAGCGPSGHIARYLADKGHAVVGIDLSEKCVEMAAYCNPDLAFRCMDMMNTDFKNDSLEGVIAFYSIIYTPKELVYPVFAEFWRVLKPGGKLLIVVKKGVDEGIIHDDWYEGKPVYFTHFVESEIRNYFASNGFCLDFLDTRKPYDFEIQLDRIYALGTKITGMNPGASISPNFPP